MRSHLSTGDCGGEEQRERRRKRIREGCLEVKGGDRGVAREIDMISSLSTV